MRLPLDTLRTFEIAARTQSFAQAARTLHLTDSAVSHQMKRLEESLGLSLFERQGRTVRLSAQGRLFLGTVESALGTLADSVRVLHRSGSSSGLNTITCSSMFGSKWLSRHLRDFVERHPSIGCNLRLVDNDHVIQDDIDVGILFGRGTWPDYESMLLGRVQLAPVCSPSLFRTRCVPTDPLALVGYPIIHQDDGREWRQWLEAAGVGKLGAFSKHIYCNDTGFAIDLACHGAGITLASDELSSSYVVEGTLVRPFATSVTADGGWYVICSPRCHGQPGVQLFFEWIASHFGAIVPNWDARRQ